MLLKKAWLHLIINKLAEGCFQFSKFISHPQRFFSNPEKKIPPFLHFKIPYLHMSSLRVALATRQFLTPRCEIDKKMKVVKLFTPRGTP